MGLSCLVISRTPALLNRLLSSLVEARCKWSSTDQVLCSWNGSMEQEAQIEATRGPGPAGQPLFQIAQRKPYHFASNMNSLARRAKGELLLLVNDDVILDPGSLDRAMAVLEAHPEASLVGGLLRTSQGDLGHAGLLFGAEAEPYNRCRPELSPWIQLSDTEVLASGPMPAVTGALMLVRRADLLAVPLRESFRECGEDVALCLDLRRKQGRLPYYSSSVTAVHNEKSTRGNTADAQDLQAVAAIAGPQLEGDTELLALQQHWQAREAAWLTRLGLQHIAASAATEQALAALQHDLEQRLNHWQQERTTLIAQREELRQRLLATWASLSWRITRPLRLLSRLRRPPGRDA